MRILTALWTLRVVVCLQGLEFIYNYGDNRTILLGIPDHVVDRMMADNPALNEEIMRTETLQVNLVAVKASAICYGNNTMSGRDDEELFDTEEYFWSSLANSLGINKTLVEVRDKEVTMV